MVGAVSVINRRFETCFGITFALLLVSSQVFSESYVGVLLRIPVFNKLF